MVLQAQEVNENKLRLLAQVPLGPALSCGEEFSWDPALRYFPATFSALSFVVLFFLIGVMVYQNILLFY